MTSAENKQRIIELQTAINNNLQGKYTDISVFFADDVIWHLPQSAAKMADKHTYNGKAEVMAMFAGDVAKFYQPQTMAFTYHSLIAEDDLVHSRFTMNATTSNNKTYENQYQSLYRLRDGQICEVWEYFDTAYLFAMFAEP